MTTAVAASSTSDLTVTKVGIIDELHRPARKNFPRRKVYVKGIDDLWQVDLVEMKPYARSNSGNNYILTVIDVLSKHAWAVPVPSKSGKDVTTAMTNVFTQSHPRKPTNVQSDSGKEFYNSKFQELMKVNGINHYSTYTHLKASVVERFNRTLKNWMWKRFSVQGNYKWVSMLPELMLRYNTKVHRTTGLRPVDVSKKHEKKLVKKLNKNRRRGVSRAVKFKPGDVVRISKYKTLFAKGYTPSWSAELFKVVRVRKTIPPVYYLRDEQGETVKGGFYSHELQRTKYPDTYLVERVIKRKDGKSFVKWLGYSNKFNSWI